MRRFSIIPLFLLMYFPGTQCRSQSLVPLDTTARMKMSVGFGANKWPVAMGFVSAEHHVKGGVSWAAQAGIGKRKGAISVEDDLWAFHVSTDVRFYWAWRRGMVNNGIYTGPFFSFDQLYSDQKTFDQKYFRYWPTAGVSLGGQQRIWQSLVVGAHLQAGYSPLDQEVRTNAVGGVITGSTRFGVISWASFLSVGILIR